jgi:hypothetical protein
VSGRNYQAFFATAPGIDSTGIPQAYTNQFHGALFETIRNSGIGVARRRQDTFSKAPFFKP